MSREINPWKSFNLLRGSNLRPLAPSAGYLTARPPELTVDVDGWCSSFIQVGHADSGFYCCASGINFLLDGVLYNYQILTTEQVNDADLDAAGYNNVDVK